MTTIVMNTLTGAVTQYDWAFQSITPTQAGDAAGLYSLGGDTDAGAAITAEARGPKMGGQAKMGLGNVYVAVDGTGSGVVIVQGESDEWEYSVTLRSSGVSRVRAGQGISENWIALGYRNASGADFTLNRIDAETFETKGRRL